MQGTEFSCRWMSKAIGRHSLCSPLSDSLRAASGPADRVLRRSRYLREMINKCLAVVKLKFLLTTNILVIKIHPGLVAHALTLTLALGLQRQEDLSELESSLLEYVPGQPGLHNKTMTQK